MRSKRSVAFGGLLCLLAAASIAPAGVHAGTGGSFVKIKHTDVEFNGTAGTVATGVARCPRGSAAIGGGWSRETTAHVGVTESLRQGERAWRVTVRVVATSAYPQSLAVFAYCRVGPVPAVRTRVGALRLGGGSEQVEQHVASCPKGKRAISGGFSMQGGGHGFVSGSFRTENRRWATEFAAPRDAPSANARVRTLAYCVDGPKGKIRSARDFFEVSTPGGGDVVSRACPFMVGSGGFRLIPAELDLVDRLTIASSHRLTPSNWESSVDAEGAFRFELRAFGYCVGR